MGHRGSSRTGDPFDVVPVVVDLDVDLDLDLEL